MPRLFALLCLSGVFAACSARQAFIAPTSNTAASSNELPAILDYRAVYAFGSFRNDGENPDAGLIASHGVLYGTTSRGGSHASGAIFKVDVDGNETLLHSFDLAHNDGAWYPESELYELNGYMYGTTQLGGAHGEGTIYRLDSRGNVEIVHSFGSGKNDGTYPFSGLVAIGGVLYGTTSNGGTHGIGTVYSLTLPRTVRVLHSFSGPDGAAPHATLVAAGGALYGVTEAGGTNNRGVVFRVDLHGNETTLHSFHGSDGNVPVGSLLAFQGSLYGTTLAGGAHDRGTVFEISPTNSEKVLYSFAGGVKGCAPQSGLVHANGYLYGVSFGSSQECKGNGTIFRISPTGLFEQLYEFKGGMGANGPLGLLCLLNQKLYGATMFGGANYRGVVFSFIP